MLSVRDVDRGYRTVEIKLRAISRSVENKTQREKQLTLRHDLHYGWDCGGLELTCTVYFVWPVTRLPSEKNKTQFY